MERERRRQLAERAEEAERRAEEIWQARVRVDSAQLARVTRLEAECHRKAAQAERVLRQRSEKVLSWPRGSTGTTWRSREM